MKIRDPGARARSAAVLAIALLCAPAAARAQTPVPTATPSPAASDAKSDKQTELRGVEDTLKASEEQRRKIESDVEALRLDRTRLESALIETTAKVQDTENRKLETGRKLAELAAQADALAKSLESRRGAISEVLAALERMGRNPPPAILVKPADMSEAVRAAIVLGSVLPQLQGEAMAAARDLDKLAALRSSMAEQRDALARDAEALGQDKIRLAGLISARQQSLDEAQGALAAERKRASELANQALSLKDLLARMEGAPRPGDASGVDPQAAALRAADPTRLKPAVAFADARGTLPLPVAGEIVKTFGAPDNFGGEEKGVSIAAPAGATVSSPIDAWALYAGPYRTYGQVLILNAGGGYYMVLSGMDRINVSVGQFVLAGEPVAVMGDGAARSATAAAIGAAQPVLYIQLRKNDTPIDPGPWWAKSTIEKAHG